jgi:hypothetical protein
MTALSRLSWCELENSLLVGVGPVIAWEFTHEGCPVARLAAHVQHLIAATGHSSIDYERAFTARTRGRFLVRVQHMANRPALVWGEHDVIRWLWHGALSIRGGMPKLSLIARGGKIVVQGSTTPCGEAATAQGAYGH